MDRNRKRLLPDWLSVKLWLYWLSEHWVAFAATFGLLVAGLAPAISFAVDAQHALVKSEVPWNPVVAWIAGIGLGATAEFVGAISAHVAIHSPNKQWRKNAQKVLATYTVVGFSYFVIFGVTNQLKQLGALAYIIAPLLYYSSSLYANTIKDEKAKQQREAKKEARQQARLDEVSKDNDLDRQIKLENHRANLALQKDNNDARIKRANLKAAREVQSSKVEPVERSKVQSSKVQKGSTKQLVQQVYLDLQKSGNATPTLKEVSTVLVDKHNKTISLSMIGRHLKGVK